MSARLPRVDIVRNEDREWYWRFIASNGRELARSSETYKRRIDAVRCLYSVLGVSGWPLPDIGAIGGGDEATLERVQPNGTVKPLLTVRVLR